MAQAQLNLFQRSTALVRQFCKSPTEVVRRNFFHANFGGVLLHALENGLCRHGVTAQPVAFVYRPEYSTGAETCGHRPFVNRHLRPRWHWNGANPATFTTHVHNHPTGLTLLNVLHRQQRRFFPAKPASDQNSEKRPVPLAFQRVRIRCVDQFFSLMHGEPIAGTDAFTLYTPHSTDAGSKVRVQEVVVGGFGSKAADGLMRTLMVDADSAC